MTVFNDPTMREYGPAHKARGIQVAAAWLFVGIPLAWGVSQTLIRSFALFKHEPASTVATPATLSQSTPASEHRQAR